MILGKTCESQSSHSQTPATPEAPAPLKPPGIITIIPTLGRPCLEVAIRSVLACSGPDDRLMVVGDGPQPAAQALCARLGVWYDATSTRTFDLACSQRQLALDAIPPHAWVCFMGDDDIYPPGALDRLREYLVPGFLCLRTVHCSDGSPNLVEFSGRCDAQIVCERGGWWAPWWHQHGGDRDFVRDMIAGRGGIDRTTCCRELTYIVRPGREDWGVTPTAPHA